MKHSKHRKQSESYIRSKIMSRTPRTNHWSCIRSSAKNVVQNTSEKRKECSVAESKSTRKTRVPFANSMLRRIQDIEWIMIIIDKTSTVFKLRMKELLHILKRKPELNKQLNSQSNYDIKTLIIAAYPQFRKNDGKHSVVVRP
jgi:hypothetical protein